MDIFEVEQKERLGREEVAARLPNTGDIGPRPIGQRSNPPAPRWPGR
ncbi:MAG: hypothetical protein JWO02_3799 [Solirubrobacterales bacterium]|nr:hypothetical protein [Solirubrobacterales bacterium]